MPTHEDDDLRIFHPLFAVAIGIGLVTLAGEVILLWFNEDGLKVWAMTAFTIVLIPIGIRMTWAVEGLSRYLAAQRALEKKKPRCDC